MKPYILILLIITISSNNTTTAKTLIVDHTLGDDEKALNSTETPFKTVLSALLNSSPNDTIFLNNGLHPEIRIMSSDLQKLNEPGQRTITGEAYNCSAERVIIAQTDHTIKDEREGTFTANLIIENLFIKNPSIIYGPDNLTFKNCKFSIPQPLNGSNEDINRVSLSIITGSNIKIENCEFTNTAIAMEISGKDINIKGCNIHHNSHDAIRTTGATNLLIEDTNFENIDDGADDPSTNQPNSIGPEEPWSKHVDGIHFFTSRGNNTNITVRGCIFKDIESQAIQFNNLYEFKNSNFLFENNIFYPTQANVFNASEGDGPVDNLTIRNNAFLSPSETPYFNSIFRYRIPQSNTTIYISTKSKNTAIYNNIFDTQPQATNARFTGYNIIMTQKTRDASALGINSTTTFAKIKNQSDLLNIQHLTQNQGTYLDHSGTPVSPTIISDDGSQLTSPPDIGPYPTKHNSEERININTNVAKSPFFDGFEDGTIHADRISTPTEYTPISWRRKNEKTLTSPQQLYSMRFDTTGRFRRNYMSSPWLDTGEQSIYVNELEWKKNYRVTLKVANVLMNKDSAGFCLLSNIEGSEIQHNIANGSLILKFDDAKTILQESELLKIPADGKPREVTYDVVSDESSVSISISFDNKQTTHEFYRSEHAKLPQAGTFGLYRDSRQSSPARIEIDDLIITTPIPLLTPVTPTELKTNG